MAELTNQNATYCNSEITKYKINEAIIQLRDTIVNQCEEIRQ